MKKPVTASDQIIARLREKGIKQADVARVLGLPRSAVSNLFSGQRRLQFDEAQTLMSLTGESTGVRELPVIGMAGAGSWLEAIEQTSRMMTVPASAVTKGGRFIVEVSGESMNLLLPEGSFAVINPTDTSLFSGRIYLLLNGDGEATIKRYRGDPARFEPVSDDDSFEPFELGAFDFRVVGRVTLAIREL